MVPLASLRRKARTSFHPWRAVTSWFPVHTGAKFIYYDTGGKVIALPCSRVWATAVTVIWQSKNQLDLKRFHALTVFVQKNMAFTFFPTKSLMHSVKSVHGQIAFLCFPIAVTAGCRCFLSLFWENKTTKSSRGLPLHLKATRLMFVPDIVKPEDGCIHYQFSFFLKTKCSVLCVSMSVTALPWRCRACVPCPSNSHEGDLIETCHGIFQIWQNCPLGHTNERTR